MTKLIIWHEDAYFYGLVNSKMALNAIKLSKDAVKRFENGYLR